MRDAGVARCLEQLREMRGIGSEHLARLHGLVIGARQILVVHRGHRFSDPVGPTARRVFVVR